MAEQTFQQQLEALFNKKAPEAVAYFICYDGAFFPLKKGDKRLDKQELKPKIVLQEDLAKELSNSFKKAFLAVLWKRSTLQSEFVFKEIDDRHTLAECIAKNQFFHTDGVSHTTTLLGIVSLHGDKPWAKNIDNIEVFYDFRTH